MKKETFEDLVGKVALEFFNYKYPDFDAVNNASTVQRCVDEAAFIITKFVDSINELSEEEIND